MGIKTSRRQFLKAVAALSVAALPPILNTPKRKWFKLEPEPDLIKPGPEMTATEVLRRQEEAMERLANRIVDPPLFNNTFVKQYDREVSRLIKKHATGYIGRK